MSKPNTNGANGKTAADELLNFIEATETLSKHITAVFNYAVIATACGTEDLPQEICSSMTFLNMLCEIIEKIENAKN